MTDLKICLDGRNDYVKLSDMGLLVTGVNWPRAQPKTSSIDIPGADGSLDLSEVLRGEAVFQNVTATISVGVYDETLFDFSRFTNKYHGRRVNIRLGDDDDYYHVGRMRITGDDRRTWLIRKFTLTVDAEPYRYALRTKSVEVPIVAAQHPQSVKVLEYRKYHVDQSDPYTYDKTTGTFTFNTTLVEDNPAGTLGISISPETWYSFSWSGWMTKEPYCYLADGTEINTPGHFYSGNNAFLRVDIGETIEGMVLMPISSGTEVINQGRKILTPKVYASAGCTIAGNLSATTIESAQLTQISFTQLWKFTGGVGQRKFYVLRTDTYYCFDLGFDIYSSILMFALRVEINYTMQTFWAYTATGTVNKMQPLTAVTKTLPSGYVPLSDYATMESESGAENENSDGFVAYDFQLAPGVNTVIAYANKAGGKVRFTYREGLL